MDYIELKKVPGFKISWIYYGFIWSVLAIVVLMVVFRATYSIWIYPAFVVAWIPVHVISKMLYLKRGLAATPWKKPTVWIENENLIFKSAGRSSQRKLTDIDSAEIFFRGLDVPVRDIDHKLNIIFKDSTILKLQSSYFGFGDVWDWMKKSGIQHTKYVVE